MKNMSASIDLRIRVLQEKANRRGVGGGVGVGHGGRGRQFRKEVEIESQLVMLNFTHCYLTH